MERSKQQASGMRKGEREIDPDGSSWSVHVDGMRKDNQGKGC